MHRRRHAALQLGGPESLERRWLPTARSVAAIVVPGNTGTIRHSQFIPSVGMAAEWEHWGLAVSGPVSIHVVPSSQGLGASSDVLSATPGTTAAVPPPNTGLIGGGSQFAAGGFLQFGAQLRRVSVGRGLSVNFDDETLGQPGLNPRPQPVLVSPVNTGDIIKTQINDGGFGNVGLQWRRVQVVGPLSVRYVALLRNPDGSPVSATTGGAAPVPGGGPPVPIENSVNSNLLLNTQVNDGGFGKVGLQWHDVRVRRSVDIGSQGYTIAPQPITAPAPTPVAGSATPVYGSPTNTGWIRDSQFNDGGFGDVGAQWWNVAVGGPVGISTSNLTIQPKRAGVGPITVNGLDFTRTLPNPPTSGSAAAPTSIAATASIAAPTLADASRTAGPAVATKNEATNSGRIGRSQITDGGFGDMGLQWMAVKVDGGVSAVHNSLSVQPQNVGQGLITVSNVRFPSGSTTSSPSPSPVPRPGPYRVIPPSPAVIAGAGGRPARLLTPPTRPGRGHSSQNEATNSGVIGHSQFADGGLGDIGLQWHDVHVHGSVRLVHNSLSVQPQGSGFAGASITNISFGRPFTPTPAGPHRVGFAVLPSLVFTPTPQPNQGDGSNPGGGGSNTNHGGPPNTKVRDHQQILTSSQADVVLQWDGVRLVRRLVIVHNVLSIQGGVTSGPVILKNIRFPVRVPPLNGSVPPVGATGTPSGGSIAGAGAGTGAVVNRASNSGGIRQNQFVAGGFGDIGLQWRGVKVRGSVTIVHNSLSVNAAVPGGGPITIGNVTFNSGAFESPRPSRQALLIVAPPPRFSRRPRAGSTRGRVLHGASTATQAVNSGILAGGQFASGGLGHIAIQWRKVAATGPVTIIDNVLSIRTSGPATSPITVENVTFG